MGMRFYEVTMPKVADQLERLNENLEVMVAELRRRGDHASAPYDDATPRPYQAEGDSHTENHG
jgi:hypothetical protein